MSPKEDRLRWAQTIKESAPGARMHEGREASDPPPSAEPATPYDLPIRDGVGSPHVQPQRQEGFHVPRITLGNLKDFGYLVAAIIAAVTWFQNRASKADVDAAQTGAVATCSSAIVAAVGPVASAVAVLKTKQAKDEKRWDALDKATSQTKSLNRPDKTSFQKFGPLAEKHGEVHYDEEVSE